MPVKFKLTAKQANFIGCSDQFPAYVGAIGTGKSTALIVKALFHAQESPNNLGVIVRKNYTDLRDSTIRDFEDYSGFKIGEQKKDVKLPNGSTILFRHGDELPTLKNLNLGFFGIEQGEELPDSVTWDMLIQRLRRDVKFRTGFLIANTNGHNWIWEKWKKSKDRRNHRLFEAVTHEHADHLPADYIKNLEDNLPKKMYRRFVLNSWDESEGRVYDEFVEKDHVIDMFPIPDTWKKGFVLDHGFRNPTAVLFYAIDNDDTIYIYDEHYETEKPVSHHAQMIKTYTKDPLGLADPSIFSKTQSRNGELFSIADEYRDYGINLTPALRSNEIAAIARVNEHFKSNKIRIFYHCKNTINEFNSWRWKEMRPGRNLNFKEEPEDKNNHLCDCLKYLIQSRFSGNGKPTNNNSSRYSVQRSLDKILEESASNSTTQYERFFDDADFRQDF